MKSSKIFIRKIQLCFSLCFLSLVIQAQQYQLAFSPVEIIGNKARVELIISSDKPAKIGTSNLIFDYDHNSLINPVLHSHRLPTPFYQDPSIKSINGSIATFNIELLVAGKGIVIDKEPHSLATIEFERKNDSQFPILSWRKTATPQTEIFLDDNNSQIISGKFLDLQPPSTLDEGMVGELAIVLAQNKNQVFVEFESQRSGNYTLELIDENGSVHLSQSYNFRLGKNSVLVNTGIFPSGNYTARLLFDEEQRMAVMELSK